LVRIDEEEKRVAEMFNCNIGCLPKKYLGIMVNKKHMIVAELSYVYLKVEKKIPTCLSVGLS
jgi:hypothetical protein